MAGFIELAGNIAKNAFGGMLKDTGAAHQMARVTAARVSHSGLLGRGAGARIVGRQLASDVVRAGLTSEGISSVRAAYAGARGAGGGSFMKGLWAGAKEVGPRTFAAGFGKRVGIGAGIGAAAGGAKAYYEGDGAGGYAKNMLGGAMLGAAAGHGVSMFKTPNTIASNLRPSTFKTAWGARNG
jgi:hypothetical protein